MLIDHILQLETHYVSYAKIKILKKLVKRTGLRQTFIVSPLIF